MNLAVSNLLGVKLTLGVGVFGDASAHNLPTGPFVDGRECVSLSRRQSRRVCVQGCVPVRPGIGEDWGKEVHLLAWWC